MSRRTAESPKVSVVIPHYNDLTGLGRCLASLETQTLPVDRFEIIVADNASPQPRAEIEALIGGRARLVFVDEKGAGPARNGGVAVATGEIFAFIDADCVAMADWLRAGTEGLRDFDFVGGHVSVSVDDPERMTGAEAFESVFAFDFHNYIINKGFTGAGNMFVWRKVFERVGGFRAAVSEDTEWSYRATGKGFRLGYVSGAEITHPARRNWLELQAKWRRMTREMYLLAAEYPLGQLRWLLRTWALPLSAVVHTPKVLRSSRLPDMRARRRALATLYRLRAWRFIEGHRQLFVDHR